MVVGENEDRVEFGVIKEINKRENISMRGRQDEDARLCIIGVVGVGQTLDVSKARGIVEGVMEIPGEGDKEDGGIEGSLLGSHVNKLSNF